MTVCFVMVIVSTATIARADESLDALLESYRAYELPLPDADAKLVRVHAGVATYANGNRPTQLDHLGWLIPATDGASEPTVLIGGKVYGTSRFGSQIRNVEFDDDALVDLSAELYLEKFGVNSALFTAIQCQAMGEEEFADKLLSVALSSSAGHGMSQFFQPAQVAVDVAYANTLWAHYANLVLDPSQDRVQLHASMCRLVEAYPSLDIPVNRWTVESMRMASETTPMTDDAVPALIDQLIDCRLEARLSGGVTDPEPTFDKLAQNGFAAVPALIAALDDQRLTRSFQYGVNNMPTIHLTVGELAHRILQEIAVDTDSRTWLITQHYSPRFEPRWDVDRDAPERWWRRAQEIGEEQYCVQHALPTADNDRWPRQRLVKILAARYPHRLPAVYRELLNERSNLISWQVAKAVTTSELPVEDKIALFVEAIDNDEIEHRRAALFELKELDRDRFVAELMSTLEAVSDTVEGPYWQAAEGSLALLVVQADDAQVWEKFTAVAHRVDVGLRMEMLGRMNYGLLGKTGIDARLRFLSTFFDDDSVRVGEGEKYEGPFAGFKYQRIEVRDFAALKAASLVGIGRLPGPDATEDQWIEFRQRVTTAIGDVR